MKELETRNNQEQQTEARSFRFKYRIGTIFTDLRDFERREVIIKAPNPKQAAELAIKHILDQESEAIMVDAKSARINLAENQGRRAKGVWVSPYAVAPSWKIMPTPEEEIAAIIQAIVKRED